MKNLNILCLTGGYIVSGKEFVTLHTVDGYRKHGHQIMFLINGWGSPAFEQLLQQNKYTYQKIKLGWLYLKKPLWTLNALFHYPGALLRFLKTKKQFKPDVIYTDSFNAPVMFYPFLKRNIIFHVNDPNSFSRVNRFFLKIADRKTKKFIAASGFIKKDLMACGIAENKIEVVHNGVNVDENYKKPQSQTPILRLGIVGQVIERKGHEDLIMALSLLNKNADIELLIFGNGPDDYTGKLKQLAKAKGVEDLITWKGFVSSKNEIYNQIDVLLAPTRNEEPFALVALEAAAHSVPVIASHSGGFPESVSNNETGFIVEKYNPQQIAEKIQLFRSTPSLVKTMGQKGFAMALSKFRVEDMQDKIHSITLQCLV